MRTYLSEDLFAPGIDAHEISLGQHEALAQRKQRTLHYCNRSSKGLSKLYDLTSRGRGGSENPQKKREDRL